MSAQNDEQQQPGMFEQRHDLRRNQLSALSISGFL